MRRRDLSSALFASTAAAALLPETTTAQTCNAPCYAQTSAEMNAIDPVTGKSSPVVPVNYSYPPGDIRRYGGDPTGCSDNAAAFGSLFKVMLAQPSPLCTPSPALGGGSAVVIPPGTYNLSTSLTQTIIPASGPSSANHGISLFCYGVVINFTGSGYAIDLSSKGTSALFYAPTVRIEGLNIIGTTAASGGIRCSDISRASFQDCHMNGFTNGSGFTLQNTNTWCENCQFRGCDVINSQTGISFVVNGGMNSFARTYVEHFFGAGISGYWFDVGGGCAVYDSRFTHIAGNFNSTALMGIGSSAQAADMTGTRIDGIDTEVSATVTGQSLIRLRDYPQPTNVRRRPTVYNVSPNAIWTGSGTFSVWADANGNGLSGPEALQTQCLSVDGGWLQVSNMPSASGMPPNMAPTSTGFIILGNNWIWVDSSGKLRINVGMPASDTAGTVVGAQA